LRGWATEIARASISMWRGIIVFQLHRGLRFFETEHLAMEL
jgi:hypothetical protein